MKKTTFFIIILAVVMGCLILTFVYANHSKDIEKGNIIVDERPNILLILVDALRPDHLGCYGYNRETSPNIDRIAKEGVKFTNFYTVCPWTNPTIASIFSGRFPLAIFPPLVKPKACKLAFPRKIDTLAEVLRKEGYRTIALVDHPAISPKLNYDQGFDRFITLCRKWGFRKLLGTPSEKILKKLSEQLDQVKDRHFFVYLHLVYPHKPYSPPPPYNALFGKGFKEYTEEEKSGIINMYDGEIVYTDQLIGNIFDDLKIKGLLDNTYLIITSDHGEGFWEHGLFEHGNSLYNELLKVPLIIYPPGGREKRPEIPSTIKNLSSCIDIYPTIMDFANIESYPAVDGKSLVRYSNEYTNKTSQVIFSENPHTGCINGVSSQDGRYKLIFFPKRSFRKRLQLFEIKKDCAEQNNLAFARPMTTFRMLIPLIWHKIVNEKRRNTLGLKIKELSVESKENMKSLGYLQ